MSRTSGIRFRGRFLLAKTETLQVWLALLIEATEAVEARDEPWFADLVSQWRVQASVRDLGCTLDDEWSEAQVAILVELAQRVRASLGDDALIAHVLSPGWSVLEGETVASGGPGPRNLVERLDEVADAFLRLLSGTLPPDPPESSWFVGAGDGWQRVPIRHPR